MPTTPQDDQPGGELERSDAYRTFVAGSRARFGDEADAWLDALPGLLRDVRDRWSLQLEQPATSEGTRLRVDVARAGDPASLEVTYPDGWWAETTHALAAWNGGATLRLLEHDPRGARLLEPQEPGTALRADPDERVSLREATGVCDRLWIPDPGGITPVATEVRAWASSLEARHIRVGRPFERELVRNAVDLFGTLGPTQGERVLLHGDLHLRSFVLAEGRRVALDPQPLVGEPAFDAASLLRDAPEELIVDVDGGRKRVRLRFEVLTEQLRCNPGRVRGWAFATSIDHAVWCCEQGDQALGATVVEVARMIRALDV
jgi:streptomycin 6-kinase